MSEEQRFIDKILHEKAALKDLYETTRSAMEQEIDELQEDILDLTNMNEEWEDKYVELETEYNELKEKLNNHLKTN